MGASATYLQPHPPHNLPRAFSTLHLPPPPSHDGRLSSPYSGTSPARRTPSTAASPTDDRVSGSRAQTGPRGGPAQRGAHGAGPSRGGERPRSLDIESALAWLRWSW
ncbi:unnamed protein product [Gadus morhua 'NCC']